MPKKESATAQEIFAIHLPQCAYLQMHEHPNTLDRHIRAMHLHSAFLNDIEDLQNKK